MVKTTNQWFIDDGEHVLKPSIFVDEKTANLGTYSDKYHAYLQWKVVDGSND